MQRYIYHYCAFTQRSAGTLTHLDGIILCSTPIESLEDYRSVKELISSVEDSEIIRPERLIIQSLTCLGRETK